MLKFTASSLPTIERLVLLLTTYLGLFTIITIDHVNTTAYRYSRRRFDRGHLRVSEYFKSGHIEDKAHMYISNDTNEIYKYFENDLAATHPITYDQLVFETLDKINDHRLSPFYIFTYDNDDDRKHSSDPKIVSQTQCQRHINYLVKNLKSKQSTATTSKTKASSVYHDQQTTPELAAFFDSYAKQESGILLGNVFWTGDHQECTHRHIFDLDYTVSDDDSESSSVDENVINFHGRYCVASLKSPKWDEFAQDRLKSKRNFFKSDRQRQDYSKLFRLQLGICLPDSCDSNSLSQSESLKDSIKLLTSSKLEHPFKDYDLFDLYCLPDETSPLRQMDLSASLFCCVMGLWLATIAWATYRDVTRSNGDNSNSNYLKQQSTSDKFVDIFSFRANYNKFMHVEQPHLQVKQQQQQQQQQVQQSTIINANHKDQQPDLIAANSSSSSSSNNSCGAISSKQVDQDNEVETSSNGSGDTSRSMNSDNKQNNSQDNQLDLRFLNAIKAMAMLWIINSHIMLLTAQTTKNILDCDTLLNLLIHFFIGGTFGVDLFFTMTGFLASYVLFNKGQAFKMKPALWLYLFFHRYWRLAPMYIMTFWFSKSIMQHMGSGPLWDYGTSNITYRGLCNQESWWYPITLTSNLHGIYDECMITSWYISCDMQFWLASPLIIYCLAKSPLMGWIFASGLIAASCALRFQEIFTSEAANYLEMVRPRADVFRRVGYDIPRTYTHPQYRICTYIIGILAGHFVYMVQSGKWNSRMYNLKNDQHHESKFRTCMACFGALLTAFISVISYVLNHYYPESLEIHAKVLATSFYTIDHFFMGIGVSLIFITLSFGQWKTLKQFLSHPFLIRVSRINYALLLLQCEAIYYQIFRYNFVPTAGTREILSILLNLFVTLYPIGLLVTVIFEYPLANLEKVFVANKLMPPPSERKSKHQLQQLNMTDTATNNCKELLSSQQYTSDYCKNHQNHLAVADRHQKTKFQ